MSKPNFYAGAGLDRMAQRRGDAAWVRERLAAANTRLVPVWRSKNLFVALDSPEPAVLTVAEHGALLADSGETVLLGLVGEVAYAALDLSHLPAPESLAGLPDGSGFEDLRNHAGLVAGAEAAVLAYARGILTWHQRHRFCGQCGAATESRQAGHLRVCGNPDCKAQHFPRTDPAVIMLVTDGERCLLGRQAVWRPGMHSTLAGFVEPGESLEEAVAREVFEESGIRVGNVRYHSSQPWPFPGSIMLGFHAAAESTEIMVNHDEIEDVRWFERDFVRDHPPDDDFRTPRPDSIARRLIEDWLAEA